MLHFAKIFLPRKFLQTFFTRAFSHFSKIENQFLFNACYLNQVYSTTAYICITKQINDSHTAVLPREAVWESRRCTWR
jgi:hypothetical protein